MSGIYRHADQGLKRLYRYVESQFQNTALTAQWDELNVLRTVSDLYQRIDDFSREEYMTIARKAYADARDEILALLPEKEGSFTDLDTLFLINIYTRYDRKTEYRYDHEWERKRDRLAESMMAVIQAQDAAKISNTNEIRVALQRALNLMERQMRQMADTMTDEARNQAFADAGVDQVMWNTQRDAGVCPGCQARDGQIYPLYAVPGKHRGCRCYLTPARFGLTQ